MDSYMDTIKREPVKLTIPADLIREEEYFVITTSKESEKILGQPICSQGKSFEEAEKSFWSLLKCMYEYHEERSRELDKWKPFQKGDWNHTGGTWFTIYGINVYFRRGNGMKGGTYIPFTKLNISINSYWKKPLINN